TGRVDGYRRAGLGRSENVALSTPVDRPERASSMRASLEQTAAEPLLFRLRVQVFEEPGVARLFLDRDDQRATIPRGGTSDADAHRQRRESGRLAAGGVKPRNDGPFLEQFGGEDGVAVVRPTDGPSRLVGKKTRRTVRPCCGPDTGRAGSVVPAKSRTISGRR